MRAFVKLLQTWGSPGAKSKKELGADKCLKKAKPNGCGQMPIRQDGLAQSGHGLAGLSNPGSQLHIQGLGGGIGEPEVFARGPEVQPSCAA